MPSPSPTRPPPPLDEATSSPFSVCRVRWSGVSRYTCLLTKYGIILIVYTNNSILLSQFKENIQYEIKSLQETFDLTEDGELKDYLGNIF